MGTLYRRNDSGPWYAQYSDANGKQRRVSTKTTNKLKAAKILKQLEATETDARFGITSNSSPTLKTLLAEFEDFLGDTSEKHRSHTKKRIELLTEGWTKPQQINAFDIETRARKLKNLRNNKPLAARTRSHYLTAIKEFTNWLTNHRKIYQRDPLQTVRKPSFRNDRKLERRFLLPEEWTYLRQCDNRIFYETAIQTGLRASELLAIRKPHLHSDHVLLPGKFTKNGDDAKQYVPAQLSKELRKALPFKVPNNGEHRTAELLRSDLAAARAIYEESTKKPDDYFLMPENELGHVLDFHALRHTCGAWLAIAGTSPKVIQKIMRHSSIQLTLDTYGHLLPGDEKKAADSLGNLLR